MAAKTGFWEKYADEIRLFGPALLVCAVFWGLSAVLTRLVTPFILSKIDAEKHPAATLLLKSFRRPVGVYMKVAGLCFGLLIASAWRPDIVPLALENLLVRLPAFLWRALRIATILCVTWGLLGASDITALLLRGAHKRLDLHLSKSVTRFLSAIFNVVVAAVAAVVLLSELGYDVNGLLAGLGLGGLTVALAAKDSAANFFGGLVLVFDKPFEIGDWIQFGNLEGAVEDINLRSTIIRTAPGALTVVPNATLSAANITNWSGGMKQRRADFTLALTYGCTREQLEGYTAALRAMLEADPEITADSVMVRFSQLGDSGLLVKVLFNTTLPGYAEHMRIRERVNYALLDLAAEHGVEFAYPTQTLYVEHKKNESPSN